MGWLSVAVAVASAVLLWGAGLIWFVAAGNAVLNFWSFGVMHNFATTASAQKIKQLRRNLQGEELSPERQRALLSLRPKMNLDHVPDWLTWLNLGSTVAAVVLLIYGIWA